MIENQTIRSSARAKLGVVGASLVLLVAIPSTLAAEPTYWKDIYPIFRKNCTVCHSQRTLQEPEISAGLALDTYQAVKKGGKQPVIVPGKSGESRLAQVLRLADANKRMPLDAKPLSDEHVALIRRWIDSGAVEGDKPLETTATAPEASGPRRLRRLPVVFPTRITRPASVEMVAPVGPLPPVAATAYNHDGSLLAVGVYGRVMIWNTREARPVASITNVLAAVNDLKFSPSGSILAVAGGQASARGDLRLFQTESWKLLASLGGHLDVVSSVAFSPDGKRLASASFDKTIRIWNVANHEVEQILTSHSDFVYSVAFGPKGDWVVSASKDRTARLSDVATGKSRRTFSGMDQDVLAVAVAPKGDAVVSSGYEASLFWWNVQTGQLTRRQAAHDVAVHELTFDRAGKIVVSAGGDKTVRWFDGSSGAPMRSVPVASMVYSVSVRPDGQQIAAGCADGHVRIIDVNGGRQLLTLAPVPGSAKSEDWLVATPEGFVAGSHDVLAKLEWRAAGKPLPGDAWRKALVQPVEVAKAWRGEKMSEPVVPALR